MKKALAIISLTLLSINLLGQSNPHIININPNTKINFKGKLENGFNINDLSWAWRSSVACFPATQQKSFNGNHVLYETVLPERSIIEISVKPKNPSTKISLYGYQVGLKSNAIVPNLTTCVSCEVDNNQNKRKKNNTRTIKLNATTNPYKVYFGVVGEEGLKKGDYTISIKLSGGKKTTAKQTPVIINTLPELQPKKTISVNGNLKSGVLIHDLSWAWNSSVACFPATQQKSFNGNHILYETFLPRKSILEVTLTPKNPNIKMSLYGYQVGKKSNYIVPNLPNCVSCEVDNNQSGRNTSNIRKIKLNTINNPYKVYLGVVGEKGLKEGDYTISIKLIGGEKETKKQNPVIVKTAQSPEKGNTLAYKDNIKNGVIIQDLSWAWNSSNACFPATQKESYTGNHILFQTEIPRYSKMTVTIKPTNPNTELSLYGYQIGTKSNYVVPNLSSCVSCEADNNQSGRAKNNTRTIQFTAINNPYKVMLGVAGPKGLKEGEFTIQINIDNR
jgi:hypothetical protein